MINDKLKKLRKEKHYTQAMVAEHLGISTQTVSKWERGLLFPDIMILPRIAVLYNCSIDSIFDMESSWNIEHRNEFENKIKELHSKNDYEGVYQAWIKEIELKPDNFSNYFDVMLHVFRKRMFDDEHVKKMLILADYAEKYCTDTDSKNEIFTRIIPICASSENPKIKEKTWYYYNKLPMLRHSREKIASFVLSEEEYELQAKKNIINMVDTLECTVRRFKNNVNTPEERLYYYKKAAAFYEIVLDGKYGGFYDVPLVSDYANIASILVEIGKREEAESYLKRIFSILEKHLTKDKQEKSELLYATYIPNTVPAEKNCIKLMEEMMKDKWLSVFKDGIKEMYEKYSKHYNETLKRGQK